VRVQIIGRTEMGFPNRWAVLDADDRLVPEVNDFLAHLDRTERSPNSIRASAYDLRAYCEFLAQSNRQLDDVTNEVLGRFARWYRSPAENITPFVDAQAIRTRSSTNRALASIAAFYKFLGSRGTEASGALGLRHLESSAQRFRPPRTTVVDNVGHASQFRSGTRLGPRLPRRANRVQVLTIQEVHQILGVCRDRRDRLLIMLAFTTGMRVGQILGLRHEDIDTRARTITVEARVDNPNGARSKGNRAGWIPISDQLNRLYIEYMHEEYGYLDNPFVFVNFETLNPWTYSAANAVVQRLRRQSGLPSWSLHTLRHTFVTLCQRAGIPIDVVSNLVMHTSIATTVAIYSHLDVDDLRQVLTNHGVWEETLQ